MTLPKDHPPLAKDADGHAVEIVTVEAEACSPVQLNYALRTLARLMLRQHREKRDPGANDCGDSRSSALTVPPNRSAHRDDEAA